MLHGGSRLSLDASSSRAGLLEAASMLLGTSLVELVLRLLRVSSGLGLRLLGVMFPTSVLRLDVVGLGGQNFMNSLRLGLVGPVWLCIVRALEHLIHDDVARSLDPEVLIGAVGISADVGYNFREAECLLVVVTGRLGVIYRFLDLILLELNILLEHHLILSSKQRRLSVLGLALGRILEHLLICECIEVLGAGSSSPANSIVLSKARLWLIGGVLLRGFGLVDSIGLLA